MYKLIIRDIVFIKIVDISKTISQGYKIFKIKNSMNNLH